MSFSQKVKSELVKQLPAARHCQIALLTSFICTAGRISIDGSRRLSVSLHTEQPEIEALYGELLNRLFGFSEITDSRQAYKVLETAKLLHLTEDVLKKKKRIVDERDLMWDGLTLQRVCCKRAFLRGIFLVCGSVNNPEKAYHLEMVFLTEQFAREICQLLHMVEIDGRIVQRKKYFIVYIKDGSMIVDFLNIIGAPLALMEMENIRILKDVRNDVNRRVNCEAANINKTVSASRKQIDDILYIESHMGFQKLPENLRQMAELRLEEPEASLTELGTMLNPPVTKSGVNHRLRKLSQIASDLRG